MQGCLALFVVFFAWLIICSIMGAILGGSAEAGMVVGTLITIVIGVNVFKKAANEEEQKKNIQTKAKNEIDKLLQNITDFSVTDSHITENNMAFIAVDEKRRKFLIGGTEIDTGNINHKIISIKDILGVEITENGKGLLSTSANKNTLGMAAVGGLLFGGAGAIVGAISGSNTKTKITEISLRIAIDNIKTPYVGINFLCEVAGKGSNEHQQVLTSAEKWYGIVSVLLERENRQPVDNKEVIVEKESPGIDHLEKAKRLINNQKYLEAVQCLSNAISENHNTSIAYYMRAVAYSKIPDKQKALSDLEQAANLGNIQAINYLEKVRGKNDGI